MCGREVGAHSVSKSKNCRQCWWPVILTPGWPRRQRGSQDWASRTSDTPWGWEEGRTRERGEKNEQKENQTNPGINLNTQTVNSPSLLKKVFLKHQSVDRRDGSMVKGACRQDWWPKFDTWALNGGRRQPTPASFLLNSTCRLCHTCVCVHKHTHKEIKYTLAGRWWRW